MTSTVARTSARLLLLPILATVFLLGPVASQSAVTPTASAVESGMTTQAELTHLTPRQRRQNYLRHRRAAIINTVASRRGSAYVYGATGPRAFDCSGLVQWTFRQLGRQLPRTSDAQAGAVKRVRIPRRGDIVFFHHGGNVYHVGIYAGRHTVWHASRPGHPVARERIWTGEVFYGRPYAN